MCSACATNAVGAICIRTRSFTATRQPLKLSASLAQTNGQFSFTLAEPSGQRGGDSSLHEHDVLDDPDDAEERDRHTPIHHSRARALLLRAPVAVNRG